MFKIRLLKKTKLFIPPDPYANLAKDVPISTAGPFFFFLKELDWSELDMLK